MLTGQWFACAHRPGHAVFDHTAELPPGQWVMVEADAAALYAPVWAAKLAGRPLVYQLGVTLDRVELGAWVAYVRGRVKAMQQAGLWDQVIAVQIHEELFGNFAQVPPASIAGWLNDVAIPVARRECQRMTWVLEQAWDRMPNVQADVVGINPYVPAWALRTGRHAEAWAYFIERPIVALAKTGRPVHVVGQAFRAAEAGDVWGEAPPAELLAWTRELAGRTPGVLALSWFCYGSMPGVVGARDLPAIRNALGVTA